MNLDGFLGNEAVKEQLTGALRSGRLAHSLLICGEDGCGTGWFARLLAADLLSADPAAEDGPARARRVLEGTDPDCIEVEGTGASGQIPVDRVRDVRTEAQQTSLSGSRRVIIIYGGQNLGAPSANALLKILEEPPSGVYFLITARNPAAVMATIRSRCSFVQLCAPEVETCVAELRRRGLSAADAAFLAKVWQGRIGMAVSVCEGSRRAIFDAAREGCDCIARRDAYGLMQLFVRYEKEKDRLLMLLGDMVQILSGSFAGQEGAVMPPAAAAAAARTVLDAISRLRGNGNLKLAVTSLCLALGE